MGGAIAAAWAAVQLALTPLLRQRTPKGQRRLHEWLGVRNYLRDFSQLADAPAGHLVLWERYLVYAVALGVSDQLAHGLEARIPPDESTRFATWYAVGVGNHPGTGRWGISPSRSRPAQSAPSPRRRAVVAGAAASPAAGVGAAAEEASARVESRRGSSRRIDMHQWLS